MLNRPTQSPLLDLKNHHLPSVFRPENMIREARRQKQLPTSPIPAVCILDADGDLLRQLEVAGRTARCTGWACYHTVMHEFEHDGIRLGILANAVGGAFAVLVAEQAFASGCEFLISITSAGQIAATRSAAHFILIERALRDEGTSYHYLPPARYADADESLLDQAFLALQAAQFPVIKGATWTTDAPFRETEPAIRAARADGLLAVEMEAAALYAFAQARSKKVLCIAQVTNLMGQIEGDFEKGHANGAPAALNLLAIIVRVLQPGASA